MEPSIQSDDDALLGSALRGNEKAFTELYRKHQGPLFRFAMHMSGSRQVAEEVTQEVFLTLIGSSVKYDPARGTVAALLFGIARNQVRRHLRHDGRFDGDPTEIVSEDDVLREMTEGERIESLREAIVRLPEAYREVIVLCELEELSYEAAAERIGCAIGTVRSRLSRGKALLAAKLRAGAGCGV